MKPEDRYHRFVHWSDEDQCYIGYCPDLYFGGVCHGELEEET
jgi:predicted RNase H-like HicB family nuclease